jgi:hypothetical protein
MPSPTGGPFYSEHDNRVAPGYDQYGEEYGGNDYPRNKRPAGFNQYKFDHRFNTPMSQNIKGGGSAANSNMDSPYRNGSGSYPGGGFNNNGNTSQLGSSSNGMGTAAQMFNNLNKMVAQVAPIIQSQMSGGAGLFSGTPSGMIGNNSSPMGQFKPNNGIMNNPNFGMSTNMDMNHFETQTQPQMMSYKQFVYSITSGNQTSKMTPEQSNKLYNEYKIKFRRDQTALFFAAHKHEEWFKLRYHPNDSTKRKEEQRETTKRRLDVFMELIETTNENAPSLHMKNDLDKKRLFKFLDGVMIRLEGGTNQDLAILETIYEEPSEETQIKEDVKEEEIDVEKTKKDDNLNSELKNETEGEQLENGKTNGETSVKNVKNEEKKASSDKKPTPPIIPQKTQSIFFKHLPVNVTRSDLEKVN